MAGNYPRTEFNIIDESFIPELQTQVERAPVFLYGITSDKGPEELTKIESRFIDRYGMPSFEKHGQASLQAAVTLASGGALLVKRVVSEDATLANTCIIAKVKKGEETTQKEDRHGNLIYLLDEEEVAIPEGEEVPVDAVPVMLNKAEIVYESMTVENAKTVYDVLAALEAIPNQDEDYDVYPLLAITDNGRGKSKKKFRIVPDYGTSKSYDFIIYRLNVIEDGRTVEQMAFSMDPNKIHLGEGFSLEDVTARVSLQLRSAVSTRGILDFVSKIEEITGRENMIDHDFLFGNQKDMVKIDEIVISENSVNLTDVFGLTLDSGDYGAMGDEPIKNESEYEALMTDFFGGVLDDNIYDKEKYPITAVIDANYPMKTKDKIEELCNFRQDMFYFADMGTEISTIPQFEKRMREVAKIREVSHYGVYYDILDDFTRKQITVTIGHGLAKIVPQHLKYGPHVPLAGILHNVIIEDAIEGTVNFIPKHTPGENQKQKMNDIRCNYVNYLGDDLIIQTLYTANEKHTQLSYSNNVLLVQDMIREIIRKCPASRYSFLHGEDLESYQSDVENVLKKYEGKFKSLQFEYLQDETMEQNKIYYAAIIVQFMDFAQAEIFNIHAIL